MKDFDRLIDEQTSTLRRRSKAYVNIYLESQLNTS